MLLSYKAFGSSTNPNFQTYRPEVISRISANLKPDLGEPPSSEEAEMQSGRLGFRACHKCWSSLGAKDGESS